MVEPHSKVLRKNRPVASDTFPGKLVWKALSALLPNFTGLPCAIGCLRWHLASFLSVCIFTAPKFDSLARGGSGNFVVRLVLTLSEYYAFALLPNVCMRNLRWWRL
jgi:hypothetical protein